MRSHRRTRTYLVLSLCALSLLGCTAEEDVGIGGKVPKSGSSTAPASGSITGGDNNTGNTTTSASPTPSPTPYYGPTLPAGFAANSEFSTGSVAIVRPQAVGVSGTGDVWVASFPTNSRDVDKPYQMTVISPLGTLKASASIATLPRAMAVNATNCYYTDGRMLVAMDSNLAITSSQEYFTGSSSAITYGLSVTYPGKAPVWKAVTTPNQVTIYSADYPASGSVDVRDFTGTPTALAFEPYKSLWAAGGQRLVKLPEFSGGTPIETTVTDLGTLTSLAVHSTGDIWVLGTTGLALYDSGGDRKIGPFNYGGDRVLLRTGNKPVVVSYTTGTITRLNADGTPDTSGTSGLYQATMPGGLNGAGLDANGNVWVSSKANDYVAHTRF